MKMGRDMTRGSIARALVLFTVPLVLSGMLQQIFNWVDAFIVGNVEGELALGGIGATTALYNLFVLVITGFTSGLSVLAAQRCGMGEENKLYKLLFTFVLLLGGVFLVIAVLGIIFTRPILKLLDTPENMLDISAGYLRLILVGVPFLAVYNTYSAILRGLGDSRAPFLSVLVCSVMNAGLDIVLVAGLRYGAAGAAAATAISQGAMTVFILLYTVKKYPTLRFRLRETRAGREETAEGSRFGLPPAIQSGVSSAGSILLQRFMNGFGDQTVAAVTTAYRVDSVLLLPIINFSSGVATVTAQNIGAGNLERAKRVLKTGSYMVAVISLCLSVLIFFAGEYVIAIFGLTPESVAIGKEFFRTVSTCYLVYGLAMTVKGYLEGTGDMVFSGLASILSLMTRILFSYAFVRWTGRTTIAYAEMFSWAVLLGLCLLRLGWKRSVRSER